MSELIKAGDFQSTVIGNLPSDWRVVQLREIVPESRKVTYGIVQPGAHDSQGVLLIRGQDYIKGWAEPDAFFRVARPLHDIFKRSLTVAGDLLICIVGATTGATNIVPLWVHEANITQTTARIACDSRKADSHFVLFALASELGQMQVRKYVKGSAQPGLNLADVECFVVPAPPPPEQRKIARILTTLDNLIEKTEALIAKYQAIKQGMMHDLFTRGVNAHGHLRHTQAEAPDLYKQSELGWIPMEWDARSIDSLSVRVGSGITPTGGSEVYQNEGVIFIRSQNVLFSGLDLSDVAYINVQTHRQMAGSEVFEFDVLLNITGASIGRCCYLPTGLGPTNTNQHVCCMRLMNANEPDAKFLASVLASPIGQNQIFRLNAGGNREGLNYKQLRSFIVPWPQIAERERITDRIVALENDEANEGRLLTKLRLQKTGLMQDLLTGKVRVKVDETGEVAAHA